MRKGIFLLLLILMSGCWGGMAVNQHLISNYHLEAPDADEQISVCYDDGLNVHSMIIQEAVFAVGYNDKFIIAKQHPCPETFHPNKAITNYYILPVKKGMDWKTKNGLMGPLTKDEFEKKRKELGLGKLDFTIEYKDVE